MAISGHAPGSAVSGVTLAMTILAAIAVSARLFARLVVVRNAGVDDGFITAALLFSIATTITMVLQGISQNLHLFLQIRADNWSSEMGHGPTHPNPQPARKH
jgi:hypothetical protein